MAKFISDEEMNKIEGGGQERARFLSDDDMSALEEKSKSSALESGARGVAQGASMGFADELTGAVESMLTDKTYEQARDESRANYAKAQADNPGTYLAGQIGGGAASTALIPGSGVARLGALGAASGLGASEAKDALGMAEDAVIGGGTGLVLGAGVKALPKIAGAAKGQIDELATAPLGAGEKGLIARGLGKVGEVGAKGNELLDKVTGAGGKAVRYLGSAKLQGALDAAENAPKASQFVAGKAANGLEAIEKFMKASPRFSSMSEGAFKALASSLSNRAAQFDPSKPVSEQDAKQSFVQGN